MLGIILQLLQYLLRLLCLLRIGGSAAWIVSPIIADETQTINRSLLVIANQLTNMLTHLHNILIKIGLKRLANTWPRRPSAA